MRYYLKKPGLWNEPAAQMGTGTGTSSHGGSNRLWLLPHVSRKGTLETWEMNGSPTNYFYYKEKLQQAIILAPVSISNRWMGNLETRQGGIIRLMISPCTSSTDLGGIHIANCLSEKSFGWALGSTAFFFLTWKRIWGWILSSARSELWQQNSESVGSLLGEALSCHLGFKAKFTLSFVCCKSDNTVKYWSLVVKCWTTRVCYKY